jgi:hypothetical protein
LVRPTGHQHDTVLTTVKDCLQARGRAKAFATVILDGGCARRPAGGKVKA